MFTPLWAEMLCRGKSHMLVTMMVEISAGIKEQIQTDCLKCFETFLGELNSRWETAKKKERKKTPQNIQCR